MTLGTFLMGYVLYKLAVFAVMVIAGVLMSDEDPLTVVAELWCEAKNARPEVG